MTRLMIVVGSVRPGRIGRPIAEWVRERAVAHLNAEWWRKALGFVTYGGASSGTRGMSALLPTTTTLGLVRVGANVEAHFAGLRVHDGVFEPEPKEIAILDKELDELVSLADALAVLRRTSDD